MQKSNVLVCTDNTSSLSVLVFLSMLPPRIARTVNVKKFDESKTREYVFESYPVLVWNSGCAYGLDIFRELLAMVDGKKEPASCPKKEPAKKQEPSSAQEMSIEKIDPNDISPEKIQKDIAAREEMRREFLSTANKECLKTVPAGQN